MMKYLYFFLPGLFLFISCSRENLSPSAGFERTLNFEGYDAGYAVVPANDGGYLVSGTVIENYFIGSPSTSDLYIKLNQNGKIIWQNSFSTYWMPADYGRDIILDSNGDAFFLSSTGFNFLGNNNSNSYTQIFLHKQNSKDETLWSNTYRKDRTSKIAFTLTMNPSENCLYIAGLSRRDSSNDDYLNVLKLSNDTNNPLIWDIEFDLPHYLPNDIAPTPDGGCIITGRNGSYSEYNYSKYGDCFITKIDKSGQLIWTRLYEEQGWGSGAGISPAMEGGYYIGGHITNMISTDVQAFIMHIDENGEILWEQRFGTENDDIIYSFTPTHDKGFILAGQTLVKNTEDKDILLIKTDALGQVEWLQTYGGDADDLARSVAPTPDGGYILTGEKDGDGNREATLFVLKVNENGER